MKLNVARLNGSARKVPRHDLTPSCIHHGSTCAVELHTLMQNTRQRDVSCLANGYVNESAPGECTASLQTCTFPDFGQRFVVQAWVTDARYM